MLTVEETQDHTAFGQFMYHECRKHHITLAALREGCGMKNNIISCIKEGKM